MTRGIGIISFLLLIGNAISVIVEVDGCENNQCYYASIQKTDGEGDGWARVRVCNIAKYGYSVITMTPHAFNQDPLHILFASEGTGALSTIYWRNHTYDSVYRSMSGTLL